MYTRWDAAIQVFPETCRRLVHDRCWRAAAALSFTTLLALVPLITVAFSMLSLFPVFETWAVSFEEFLYRNMLPATGDTIQEYLGQFVSQAGRLTAVGLVILMVSALLLFATIEDAINDIWRTQQGRRLMQRLMVYWTVITLGPILIVASLSVTSYILSLPFLSTNPNATVAVSGFLRLVPVLFEITAFMLFYMAIPNCVVKFESALVGSIVATILFELAKRGFVVFLLNFNSYEVVYGALAAIPIFLVWIYLSWLVVLIGAHASSVWQSTMATYRQSLMLGDSNTTGQNN